MSKEQEQLKQMVDSIRYIFICDYYYCEGIIDRINIEKGTVITIRNVLRNSHSNDVKVMFLLGRKIISMPIDDFKFCTKSFDSRETSVD